MSNLPPNNKSISGVSDVLNLDGVVFIGRTFLEYMRMFNLDTSQLGLKILDCPSGASSFVAEASSEHQVGTAVGCDLLYGNIDRFCHLLHDMPSQKFLTIYFFLLSVRIALRFTILGVAIENSMAVSFVL
jgi:hypothetical protein